MKFKSAIEIFPWEAGKKWKVLRDFTVWNRSHTKSLTTKAGFESDYYSVVPNLPDPVPAVAHDDAFTFQQWDDGASMTETEANDLLYWLMQSSRSMITRMMAWTYYKGVCLFGHFFWGKKQAVSFKKQRRKT